ncbi:MAG: N-acetylmuramoyl-L-alanine amidase [Thermodesulfobacteriota bacterium]
MPKKFSPLMLCCLAFFLLQVLAIQSWAGPAQDFQKGWRQFHELVESEEKAKYRSNWMQIKSRFQAAYQANPQGSYAPKSLYYLGRTYQELGKRSFLDKDFKKALEYFERMVHEFPSHSWADDAKLYKAKIQLENLQKPEQAYLELLHIEHNYPDGDMLSKAKEMLKELDREFMQQVGISPEEEMEKLQEEQTSESDPGRTASGKQPTLQDIRHWSSDEYTRVVLDLEQEAEFEHFLLKPNQELGKSHRLVVDLKEVGLGQKIDNKLDIQDGLVQQVRSARRKNGVSRVVLDIGKIEDYRVFSLQNPFRVVLDLHGTSQQKKQKSLAQGKVPQGFSLDEQSKAMSDSLVEQLGLGIQTVMIDAGHGGKDPGAVAGGVQEKNITLRFAEILGEVLEERGLQVKYTRQTDKFLPLEERTALANSKKADLFLSVHVNAHKSTKLSGFEIYYLNLAQSEDSVRVAARENAVSKNKISDLQMILTDLMLNSKIKESRNLANVVLTSTMDYGKKFYSLNENGVRRAPFYVLMGAKMPAVLLELGYLTNPTDRKNLQSYTYLKRLAWGVANGIEEYKKNIQEYASLEN